MNLSEIFSVEFTTFCEFSMVKLKSFTSIMFHYVSYSSVQF